jgi:hypothetical protein
MKKNIFFYDYARTFIKNLESILDNPIEDIFNIIEGDINNFSDYFESDISWGTNEIYIEDGHLIGLVIRGDEELEDYYENDDDSSIFIELIQIFKDQPDIFKSLPHLILLDIYGIKMSSIDLTNNPLLVYFYTDINYLIQLKCTKVILQFAAELKSIEDTTLIESSPKTKPLGLHISTLISVSNQEYEIFSPVDALSIINNTQCDLGTALYIYWNFLDYHEHELSLEEIHILLETIENNVKNQQYSYNIIPYKIHFQKSTVNRLQNLRKIPDYMFQNVVSGYLK